MGNEFQLGNSFDSQSFKLGHAKKVWRRIEEQLPGMGRIVNMSDFASVGKIRSGMALAKSTEQDADDKDLVAIPFADIVTAVTDVATTYEAVADPAAGANPMFEGWYVRSGAGTTESPYEYELTDDVAIPVSDAPTYYKVKKDGKAAGIDSLGIIGFLQEDVPVIVHSGTPNTYNYATGNVVVKGEIYGYMLGDTVEQAAAVSAAVKSMTQKNGLSIRVVD